MMSKLSLQDMIKPFSLRVYIDYNTFFYIHFEFSLYNFRRLKVHLGSCFFNTSSDSNSLPQILQGFFVFMSLTQQKCGVHIYDIYLS